MGWIVFALLVLFGALGALAVRQAQQVWAAHDELVNVYGRPSIVAGAMWPGYMHKSTLWVTVAGCSFALSLAAAVWLVVGAVTWTTDMIEGLTMIFGFAALG